MTRTSGVVAAIALLAFGARPALAVDDLASNERLGARIGYIETFDGLHGTYRDGWDVTLFFTEKVYAPILLDIRLGAIYLGDLLDPDLDDAVTTMFGIVSEMRVFYFSVGPLVGFHLTQNYSGSVSLGFGVYSVSQVFDSGVSAFDYSDQHLGLNGGVGLLRRIAASWSLEANCTVHYFSTDADRSDLYWVFTGGADDPLLVGVAIGAVLDLR